MNRKIKSCVNCKHLDIPDDNEPCFSCNGKGEKWENRQIGD